MPMLGGKHIKLIKNQGANRGNQYRNQKYEIILQQNTFVQKLLKLSFNANK